MCMTMAGLSGGGVGGEHGEGLNRMGDLGWWLGSDISVGGELGVVKALTSCQVDSSARSRTEDGSWQSLIHLLRTP